MTTLEQIRQNKIKNAEYQKEIDNNYNNPTSLSIISQIIKQKNIQIINEFSKENGLSKSKNKELINKFIKPNYYTPYIVNSEIKEHLQQLI